MKFSILFAITLVALSILVRPSPAAADFTVCNSTTDGIVNIAWAVSWIENDGSFYTESHGWWTIAQNKCKVLIAPDISHTPPPIRTNCGGVVPMSIAWTQRTHSYTKTTM